MSVLIAIHDDHQRKALKEMLVQIFHFKHVMDATTTRHAIEQTLFFQRSLKLIITDGKLEERDGICRYLDWLQTQTTVFDAAVLVVEQGATSSKYSCVDCRIQPPFSLKKFESSLRIAMMTRGARKNINIVASSENSVCRKIFEHSKNPNNFIVHSLEELNQVVSEQGSRIGALWLDSLECTWLDAQWLTAFRKTNVGLAVQIIGIEHAPAELIEYRTVLTKVVAYSALRNQNEFTQINNAIKKNASTNIEVLCRVATMKGLKSHSNLKQYKKELNRGISFVPANSTLLTFVGEKYLNEKKIHKAHAYFTRVIADNPYHPQAHILLLTLLKVEGRTQEYHLALKQASLYCPGIFAVRLLKEVDNSLTSVELVKDRAA